MQNLARLGVGGGVEILSLVGGEMQQHAARDGGVHPQGLKRGDQRVTTEHRAEPGHAGVRIGAFGRVGDEDGEIARGAAQAVIEILVGGRGRTRRARCVRAERRARCSAPSERRSLAECPEGVASQRISMYRPRVSPGLRVDLVERPLAAQFRRLRFELQQGAAHPAVEAGVGERNAGLRHAGGMEFAPSRAARAPHFKKVGEIGGKIEGDFDAARRHVEIVQSQAVVGRARRTGSAVGAGG